MSRWAIELHIDRSSPARGRVSEPERPVSVCRASNFQALAPERMLKPIAKRGTVEAQELWGSNRKSLISGVSLVGGWPWTGLVLFLCQ
ncbi:hypothetical protein VULLAG_LOCUS10721 [Vulpes lagopus]